MATISVDYKNDSGLRFYQIDLKSGVAKTWAITDDDYLYFDGPRPADLVSCQNLSIGMSQEVLGLRNFLILDEK